jgi:hypothetical protein
MIMALRASVRIIYKASSHVHAMGSVSAVGPRSAAAAQRIIQTIFTFEYIGQHSADFLCPSRWQTMGRSRELFCVRMYIRGVLLQ